MLVSTSRIPTEDWSGAQSKYKNTPTWTSWVNSRKAGVDAWTVKPRERADLIGGWIHDYIDPATGASLTWTPDSPEPPDGVTDKEVKFKRAWVALMRDYNISRVGESARLFRTTGEARYAEWAASQLDFYATHYASWPESVAEGKSHMYRQGLDEAVASFNLLDAARLLEGYAGPARSGIWRSGLFMPMAQNLKSTSAPLSNIGLWHAAAIAAIGMHYHDDSLVDWGLNGSTGVRKTVAAGMTSDYMWYEGSFSYNSYVVSALNNLYVAAALEGNASLVQAEKATIARLLLARVDYRFPDGMLPTPSDARKRMPAIDVEEHFAVYRSVPTYWGVLRSQTRTTWDKLIDPPPAVPAVEPTLPAAVTSNFPGNRMAMLRDGGWNAFILYGQVFPNHVQQEAPSYELYFNDIAVSTDSGTVDYGLPLHIDYFKKAPANNMALVDGIGQTKWAAGTVDLFDGVNSRIAVTQPAYLPNASVSRDFKASGGAFTERTVISTSDSLTHRLGVVFHTGCTVSPLSGLTLADVSTVRPPANAATAYWTGMTPYRAATNWSVSMSCAGKAFTYSVRGPASQTVFLGTGPTTPLPARRAVLYYESTAATAQFNVTVSPD